MSLRSGSSLSVMEEEPLRPGEILSTSAHRLRQAMTLYEVHSGMGGKLGAAFAAVLRREFPSITAAESDAIQAEVRLRVADHRRQDAVAQRMWTAAQKQQLLNFFAVVDADGSGSISRNEFLEVACLIEGSRAKLGKAFDDIITEDRRRAAHTPGGSVELTVSQFTRLIASLDDGLLRQIKAMLPHIADPQSLARGSLIVYDDGKQQLQRLVPGGRTLVRKSVEPGAPSRLASVATRLASPLTRSSVAAQRSAAS